MGNLGQEVDALPLGFRAQLTTIFMGWQQRVETCLIEAQTCGELDQNADCTQAAEFFWIGWEGAVSRAKLVQHAEPLLLFIQYFLQALPK